MPEEAVTVNGKESKISSTMDVPDNRKVVMIHSHETAIEPTDNPAAFKSGNAENPGVHDPTNFKSFNLSVIVGNLGDISVSNDGMGHYSATGPDQGAVFYDTNGNQKADVTTKGLTKILKH